ncbi:NDR1 HIN1 1 [Olea europaea subsp. europaea]|uniref:NDR1 HIN1 1 n=1 Tax=Olea europaea subsp. europaea TaxID=158383 RepID=A0A8S0RBQ6_OLEEU|nr:NDR1 HIN1 1 [Olea europaea subsp. europaea]
MKEDCGQHDDWKKKIYIRILIAISTFIFIVLFIILLVWLILRPTKPHFILRDATVYAFNLSAPNLLTSNLQITLSSHNPNGRIGIYYDRLEIYASYHSQQITLPELLPCTYLGHKDNTVWSPVLIGSAVPVAPYLAISLNQDQMVGTVLINFKVDGRIRWRVGTFVSGKYHLYVNCPAYINFGNKNCGIAVGNAIKYQLIMNCHVDV